MEQSEEIQKLRETMNRPKRSKYKGGWSQSRDSMGWKQSIDFFGYSEINDKFDLVWKRTNNQLEEARHSNNPNRLRNLAKHSYWQVRYKVALNPNTPAGTLTKLADDEDWLVRRQVAENPNIPLDILEKLANDKNEDVRLTANRKKFCF